MNIKNLSAGLAFRGKVSGRRQTYYVFEGPKAYFVFSFSLSKPKAGYFNLVDKAAFDYAEKLVAGRQGVTSQDLFKRSRKKRYIGSALEALNILYVMVALGQAKIDHRHKTGQLFFNAS